MTAVVEVYGTEFGMIADLPAKIAQDLGNYYFSSRNDFNASEWGAIESRADFLERLIGLMAREACIAGNDMDAVEAALHALYGTPVAEVGGGIQ